MAQDWPPGVVNNEQQAYTPSAASQDPNTGEVTIRAEKHSDGTITSARLESYQVWSTAQSGDIKTRGYVEVRATIPAKVDGGNLRGAWPAIWMLGTGNGHEWPRHGEIDIVEAVNGEPKVELEEIGNEVIIDRITSDCDDCPLNSPQWRQWTASLPLVFHCQRGLHGGSHHRGLRVEHQTRDRPGE